LQEMPAGRLCAKCGASVIVPALELAPCHRRGSRRHAHAAAGHADAAWAVIVLALTLLIALLALIL
jgi:hypothetical protein